VSLWHATKLVACQIDMPLNNGEMSVGIISLNSEVSNMTCHWFSEC